MYILLNDIILLIKYGYYISSILNMIKINIYYIHFNFK